MGIERGFLFRFYKEFLIFVGKLIGLWNRRDGLIRGNWKVKDV